MCVGHDHSLRGTGRQGHRSRSITSMHGRGNAVMQSVLPLSRTVFLVGLCRGGGR